MTSRCNDRPLHNACGYRPYSLIIQFTQYLIRLNHIPLYLAHFAVGNFRHSNFCFYDNFWRLFWLLYLYWLYCFFGLSVCLSLHIVVWIKIIIIFTCWYKAVFAQLSVCRAVRTASQLSRSEDLVFPWHDTGTWPASAAAINSHYIPLLGNWNLTAVYRPNDGIGGCDN